MENTEIGTTEQTAEVVRADMEAGFNEATTGQAQTETPAAPAAENPPAPDVVHEDQETVSAEVIEPEETVIAGYKESELKARLAKLDKLDELDRVRDAVRGDYGGLKKAIDELRAQVKPKAGGTRLERIAARLEEQFPEMFADIPQDEPSVQPEHQEPAPQGVSAEQIAAMAAEIEQRAEQRAAIQILNLQHPDRGEIVKTPEYRKWLETMKPDDRQAFLSSWDAAHVASKLSEFKDWRAKRKANEDRLRRAVPAQGVSRASPSAISEEEAKKQGFDSVFT